MLWQKELSEKGQGMVEYAFVLALVVLIGAAIAGNTAVGQAIAGISDAVVGLFDAISAR